MEHAKTESAAQSIGKFVKGFDEMTCWIDVSHEKFDAEKFRKDLGPKAANRDFYSAPTSGKASGSPYHIDAKWFVDDDEIMFRLEFQNEKSEAGKSELATPPAEAFMEWLGSYFRSETAQVHIHARFEYPIEERQSAFPLPLKTTLKHDAEIDGIALKLPLKPEGVSNVRITQGQKNWYVEAIANRRTSFKKFSPYSEIHAFSSVIDALLEEKAS